MSDNISKQTTERIYKSLTEGSDSTQKCSTSNLQYVNKFCSVKKMGVTFDKLNETTVCDPDFLDELASFLTATTHLNSDDPLKVGSALQIFSDLRKYLKKKFPQNKLWDEVDWYSELRLRIQKTIGKQFILDGVPICDKSPGLGRFLLAKVFEACFRLVKIL